MHFFRSTPRGTTLVEVILAVAILAMLSLALYAMIRLGIQIVRDDQSRLDAVAIAQSRMEEIKNSPYDNIGTVGGVPSGPFAQEENVTSNNITFTIKTKISYIDDSFDGVAPTDTVNTDYKKIRVKVTWQGQFLQKPITLLTTVAPEGIETSVGGGTLWVEVYNAQSNPVSDVTIKVTNSQLNPAINITGETDTNGRFILPGATPAVQSYHLETAKNGYSVEQTYATDLLTNPNPDPADQTVAADEVTTKIFYIDLVSSLAIHVQDLTAGTPLAALPLTISGTKKIGTDTNGMPIIKYNQTFSTDANGDIALTNLEYDTYTISMPASSDYDFAGSTPHLPYILAPQTTATMKFLVTPDAANTLLVTTQDANAAPLANAAVRLYDTFYSYDITQTTNDSGQTFFTPLITGAYTLEVTLVGYDFSQTAINISSDAQQIISLTLSSP